MKCCPEWFEKVFTNLVNTDATHSSHSESANQGVAVSTIDLEGGDCHQGKVGLGVSIVDDVQVYELLELQVVRLDAIQYIDE